MCLDNLLSAIQQGTNTQRLKAFWSVFCCIAITIKIALKCRTLLDM